MSRRSPPASPLHLSPSAPSHHPSPTHYLTYQHSTTPSNTLLTLRHPRSHQAELNQASHIIYPSLSISHHPTASFPFQTRDLQTSASTSLPSTPHLHFTITASNQLHLCFTPIVPQQSITQSPPNPPIDPTPLTTPTPGTTRFPVPSQHP